MIYLNYLGKMGQLGNQLFQYAALKGIANHKGYDFAIPNHNELIVDALGNKLRIELFTPFKLKGVKRKIFFLEIDFIFLRMLKNILISIKMLMVNLENLWFHIPTFV